MTAEQNAADPPPVIAQSRADRTPLVPSWVRVLVVLTVLPMWSAGVMFSLFALGRLPDVAWMAIPSGVIVAVAPSWTLPKRKGGGST